MKEQADGLQSEIDEINNLLLESQTKEKMPSMPEIPSQKDLKDYSNKLQNEFLKSAILTKIAKIS